MLPLHAEPLPFDGLDPLPCVIIALDAITLHCRMRGWTQFRSLWSQWLVRCLRGNAEARVNKDQHDRTTITLGLESCPSSLCVFSRRYQNSPFLNGWHLWGPWDQAPSRNVPP